MTAVPVPGFEACVEKIEAAYEFMLAYAAQGRDKEPPAGAGMPSIRHFLAEMHDGVAHLSAACEVAVSELGLSAENIKPLKQLGKQLKEDAGSAEVVIAVVLHAPALSSQLIDNLNASAHLRCLLTTIFVMDEVLGQYRRQPA